MRKKILDLKKIDLAMGWFFLAVTGAYILGNAEILSQWIGWSVCSASCLI